MAVIVNQGIMTPYLLQILSVKSLTKSVNVAPPPLVKAVAVPAREVKLTVQETDTKKRRCFKDTNLQLSQVDNTIRYNMYYNMYNCFNITTEPLKYGNQKINKLLVLVGIPVLWTKRQDNSK